MKEEESVQFANKETNWVQQKSCWDKKTNKSVWDYEDSGTRKGEGSDQEKDQKKKLIHHLRLK